MSVNVIPRQTNSKKSCLRQIKKEDSLLRE